jgi:hypothetical protein
MNEFFHPWMNYANGFFIHEGIMQMDCSSMNELWNPTVRFKIDSPAKQSNSHHFITFPAHHAIWEPMTTLHMTQITNWLSKKDKISSCKQIGEEKKKDKISSCQQIGEGKKRTRFLLVNKLGEEKKRTRFLLVS